MAVILAWLSYILYNFLNSPRSLWGGNDHHECQNFIDFFFEARRKHKKRHSKTVKDIHMPFFTYSTVYLLKDVLLTKKSILTNLV